MAAWHGPDKHKVRFAASVATLSFILLIGAATVGYGKTVLGMWPAAPTPSLAVTPSLTPEQQELVSLTHAVVETPVGDAEQAKLINASLPFSTAPIRAARPFMLTPAVALDRQMALDCLSQAIYYEAGFEPLEGRRAVAQVILNRLRHPAFPKTVCGVVYEGASRPGCQFSFACDGSLHRGAPAAGAWREARQIAEQALAGHVAKSVGQATHYHTDYVAPYWAPKLTKIRQIGAHIFYRWPGGWGEPGAFTGRYAGYERSFTPSKQEATPLLALAEPQRQPAKVEDPTDRRAENDVGGRIDVEKGWTLTIPLPTEQPSSLSTITADQGEATGV